MLSKEELMRLNALAAKKKQVGLNEVELAEQTQLRQAYLANLRASMRHSIEGMKIIDEEGNDVTPEKLKQIQKQKGYHDR